MVKIASNAGDGAEYDVPLFKVAASLPLKLNESTQPAPLGLGEHLQESGYKGTRYPSITSHSMGGMNPYSMLALPAILQEAYDALPAEQQRGGARFFAVLAMQYVDKQGTRRQYQSFFDAESAYDESTKHALEAFMYDNKDRIEHAAFWVVAASQEPKVTLPAANMSQNIQFMHERMFDRTRYEFGLHQTAEGELSGVRLQPDPAERTDKLVELVAGAYGGRILRQEQPGQEPAIIIPDAAFEAMERGEMPVRYKGK